MTDLPVARGRTRDGAVAREDRRPTSWTDAVAEFAGTGIESDLNSILDFYWLHMVAGEHRAWAEHMAEVPRILGEFLLVGSRAGWGPATLNDLFDAVDWLFSGPEGSGCNRPDTALSLRTYVGNVLDKPDRRDATVEKRRNFWAIPGDRSTLTVVPETKEIPVRELTEAIRATTDAAKGAGANSSPYRVTDPAARAKIDKMKAQVSAVPRVNWAPEPEPGDLPTTIPAETPLSELRAMIRRNRAELAKHSRDRAGGSEALSASEADERPGSTSGVPTRTRDALRAAQARMGKRVS